MGWLGRKSEGIVRDFREVGSLRLGGKHWKSGSMPELLPEEAELLKAPKARKPVARLEIKRVVRPKLEVDREPPVPEKHQKLPF